MSRSISAAFYEKLNRAQVDEIFPMLLTISHSSLSTPRRFCANRQDITSRGDLFTAYPFAITLPKDTGTKIPTAKIVLDTVIQDLVSVLRALTTPATVLVELVTENDFDTVEMSFPDMTLATFVSDEFIIVGDLVYEDFMNEPTSPRKIDSFWFPGVYGAVV